MSLWGGRFTGTTDAFFAYYNASFRFDRRLLHADLQACAVQARALGKAGVLQECEVTAIVNGLAQIGERFADPVTLDNPQFANAEDVHSFIEARLVELIGPAGFKLHTGRSRNDQVAVATRVFLRGEIDGVDALLRDVQRALIELAEKYQDAPLPGYTHLQKAQPVLFAHYLLAYFQMLARDGERLRDVRRRVNVLPLGSGALAGTNFPVDREWMAAELGFDSVTRNSLDAVSDRDYVIEFVHTAALTMMHLSRLAEDLIIYSTQEFGFIKLGDAIATGSSLMPQKKNPDSLELIRGKAARVFGHSTALLTLAKGTPLAYNKDFQEDKEALFDTLDTLTGSLRVAATDLSGTFVALTGQGGDGSATELVVASPKGEVMRRTYEGSLMPEALSSTDPATQVPFQMFVLRYVDGGATWASTATSPARRRYEVRAIDLASGSLTNPLQLRTKLTVAQEMNAEPLGAVTSTAMSMVFSLYRGTEDGDSELAFVHALHPDQGVWCLDLPAELELLTRPGSLGLADGGRRLLAASSNGLISETNIEALLDPQRSPGPTRTVRAWSPTDATATPHLASAGDSLAVAQGRQVAWLASGTLGVESRVTLDRPARAVAMATPRSLVVADDTGLSIVGGAIAARLAPLVGAESVLRRAIVSRDLAQVHAAVGLASAPSGELNVATAEAVAGAARRSSGATHALALLIELDEGADRIEFGGTICLAIATADRVATRRARLLGGRDWIRLGAIELGLDCLRRFLQGLPVDERIDFEKV